MACLACLEALTASVVRPGQKKASTQGGCLSALSRRTGVVRDDIGLGCLGQVGLAIGDFGVFLSDYVILGGGCVFSG